MHSPTAGDFASRESEAERRSGQPLQGAPRGDILIVDDVPANLRLLSEMLTRQQFKVRSVINGYMALMAARAEPPDLILLDINMPGMTGYEVCEHLRADERTRDIPVIFISALDATDDKVKAFTVGGMDYVTKPFQIEEVVARVETHLALRRLQVELQEANRELEKRVEERTAEVVQLAVEKGQWERELQMAREVQVSFLPQQVPQMPGWEFAARWRPVREVAGDYYDYVPTGGEQLGLVIADVTDKGMPAALFMMLTRSIVRASLGHAASPARGIAHVNRLLCADASGGMFVSLFYALIGPSNDEITYVNAGHNPPLLCRAKQGQVKQLMPTGMVLGVQADAPYQQDTVLLQAGEFIVLYTDGVPDAIDAQTHEFGMERLERIILDNRHESAMGVVTAVEQAIDNFIGDANQFDDIAIMVAKRS